MLGWDVLVYRSSAQRPAHKPWEVAIARWTTGLGGLEWIEQLVKDGKAESLGDNNGYPCRYRLPARYLLAALAHGVPAGAGPMVFGTDYVLPANWSGPLHVDPAQVAACDPDEALDVEAWDQS